MCLLCIILLFYSKEALGRTNDLKFKIWGQPVIVSDLNKSWSIKLNHKLKRNTVNNYTIFIEDELGNKIDTSAVILSDKKQLRYRQINLMKI